MKRLLLMGMALMVLLLGVGVGYAQETDAPDDGTTTYETNAVTNETDVVTNENVTAEKEIVATEGVVYNNGKTDFVSADVKFVINANDVGSGVKAIYYSMDDGTQAEYNAPITVEKEGKHNIAFRVEDNVGNQSPVKNYDFVMDNTAPDTVLKDDKVLVKVGNTVYYAVSNIVSVFAKDAFSGVQSIEYNVDGANNAKIIAPVAVIMMKGENGAHKINYKSTDNVGNVSDEKTYEFYLDVNIPTVEIATDPAPFAKDGKKYISESAQIVITAKDNESGVKKVLFTIDGTNYNEYTGSFNLSAGSYTIGAKAIDLVGNVSAVVTYVVEVDASQPEGNIVPTK